MLSVLSASTARLLTAQRHLNFIHRAGLAAACTSTRVFKSAPIHSMATAALPATMQAILVSEVGGPERMQLAREVPVPVPGPGSVLVRNRVAGVNFIDTYHRSGLYPVAVSPFAPGVEGAGEVAAVGPGVEAWRPGDRVAYVTRPPAGSYAQYTVVPEGKLARVPEGVDLETAAASMIQGMTAMSLVTLAYPVKAGDTVLVTAAAGGTGRLVAQLAAAAGARVIGTASTPEKAEVARRAGCSDVVLYGQQDLVTEVMRLTGGRGVAAVYDGVGRATFDAGLACLQKLGFMVSFGNASGKVPDLDILRLTRNNVRLMRPALWDFIATPEEYEALSFRTLEAVTAGTLKLLVTGRYPLVEAEAAHRDLEGRRTTGKLVLLVPE